MCSYKNIILNLRQASHRITVNTTSVYLWGSKSLFIFLCSSCAVLTCGVCERKKEKRKEKGNMSEIKISPHKLDIGTQK